MLITQGIQKCMVYCGYGKQKHWQRCKKATGLTEGEIEVNFLLYVLQCAKNWEELALRFSQDVVCVYIYVFFLGGGIKIVATPEGNMQKNLL